MVKALTASGLTQSVIDKLKLAPYSVEELASDLKTDARLVAIAINPLRRAGAIVKLEGRQTAGV